MTNNYHTPMITYGDTGTSTSGWSGSTDSNTGGWDLNGNFSVPVTIDPVYVPNWDCPDYTPATPEKKLEVLTAHCDYCRNTYQIIGDGEISDREKFCLGCGSTLEYKKADDVDEGANVVQRTTFSMVSGTGASLDFDYGYHEYKDDKDIRSSVKMGIAELMRPLDD